MTVIPRHTGQYIAQSLSSLMLIVLAVTVSAASESKQGKSLGAIASEKPAWFKQSFLEFEADVAEAAAQGRRVMLYFHQDGCPYCARLIQENFTDPNLKTFMIDNFDSISLNMWGDREIISVAGQVFTEKSFAAALKVQYTPTLVFLDESGQIALRLNGYYPPQDLRAALQFVSQKMERRLSFAQYRHQRRAAMAGTLIDEDFFIDERNFQQLATTSERPLVIYFESPQCEQCQILHRRILSDTATRKLVSLANNVQLPIDSDQHITTPAGKRTTVKQWVQELGIAYSPSLLFFNDLGAEVMRIDAFVKTFHFQSVYAYVLERAYRNEPQFQRYISTRAESIREAGFDTDIWGYDSFHD